MCDLNTCPLTGVGDVKGSAGSLKVREKQDEKRNVCREFLVKGCCAKASCTCAHEIPICWDFENGHCERDPCRYRHEASAAKTAKAKSYLEASSPRTATKSVDVAKPHADAKGERQTYAATFAGAAAFLFAEGVSGWAVFVSQEDVAFQEILEKFDSEAPSSSILFCPICGWGGPRLRAHMATHFAAVNRAASQRAFFEHDRLRAEEAAQRAELEETFSQATAAAKKQEAEDEDGEAMKRPKRFPRSKASSRSGSSGAERSSTPKRREEKRKKTARKQASAVKIKHVSEGRGGDDQTTDGDIESNPGPTDDDFYEATRSDQATYTMQPRKPQPTSDKRKAATQGPEEARFESSIETTPPISSAETGADATSAEVPLAKRILEIEALGALLSQPFVPTCPAIVHGKRSANCVCESQPRTFARERLYLILCDLGFRKAQGQNARKKIARAAAEARSLLALGVANGHPYDYAAFARQSDHALTEEEDESSGGFASGSGDFASGSGDIGEEDSDEDWSEDLP